MPNKTVYVSDADLPLYQRAQELAGGNLSAAIATALRQYIAVQEGREMGYKEVTVRVGIGRGRKQRFLGILLAEWARTAGGRIEEYRVYRTPKGAFAVYLKRSPAHIWTSESGEGWRTIVLASLGIGGDESWGSTPGDATLEVFQSLEALRERVPSELYDLVASMPDPIIIEDLDI